MRKIISVFLAMCLMLSASACASVFSAEYYYSEPFRGDAEPENGGETEVRNATTLKSAIMQLVYAGETNAQFRFPNYSGSLMDDLAEVCHDIKNSTPIGAYAVEDISYDTTRIVSYYTADISIEYRKTPEEIASVTELSGLGELGSHILGVMDSYTAETVVQMYSFAADENYIHDFIEKSYYEDPFLCAAMPDVSVAGFPEGGPERIYVIKLRYGAQSEILKRMETELRAGVEETVASIDTEEEIFKALRCAAELSESSAESGDAGQWADTAYGAIVGGSGSPLGLAMGYKALCDTLGIECMVVLGERRSEDGAAEHAWNIIALKDEYYHVDVSRFFAEPVSAFLLSDDDLWGEYIWDTESYPVCSGSLGPGDVFEIPVDEPAVPDESVQPELPEESPAESTAPSEPEESPEPIPPEATEPVE